MVTVPDTNLTIPQAVYEAFFPRRDMTRQYHRWTDYQVVYVGPLGADPKTLAAEIRTLSFQGWRLDRIFGDFLFMAKERWCEIVEVNNADEPGGSLTEMAEASSGKGAGVNAGVNAGVKAGVKSVVDATPAPDVPPPVDDSPAPESGTEGVG